VAHKINAKPTTKATETSPVEEIKVFLSYSRKDAAALQRIADALIAHPEFQPDFDKAAHDPDKVSAGISADEPWWQRLEQMIAGAEAMVFLVSPYSAASKVCDEEIAYAQRLGKRIIPVLTGTVDFAKLPPKLSSLNIAIDITETGPGFEASMDQLIRVLSINAAWLREGRRYTERAADWERKARPKGGLLPTGAFEEAEAWASRRPKNEPEPGELFTAWIAASRANIQEQLARERRQIRRARIWQAAAGFILVVGFSALAAGTWFVAQGQRSVGLSNSRVLTRTSQEADARGPDGLRLLSDGGARAAKLAIAAYSDSALGPAAIDADFRLGAALGRSQLSIVLEGNPTRFPFAAVSPDGTRIVTASDDSAARIWRENEDGTWTSAILEGHRSFVMSAAFSPDSTSMVTASYDTTARVWREGEDGTWNSTALKGHKGWISSAAFSPDGTRIVTASEDNTARVWQRNEQGEWTSKVLEGHGIKDSPDVGGPFEEQGEGLRFAAFSPDGARVVTAADDHDARVWRESEDGTWISSALKGHEDAVKTAAFSQDGALIVTASSDNTARIWREGDDGAWTSLVLEGHEQPVETAAFSPDGTRVVTSAIDTAARVWSEGEDGTWASTALEGHAGIVSSAAFSPDGTRIVTVSGDRTARVWRESENGGWASIVLEGHQQPVETAVFSHDGNRIVTASSDNIARVWSGDEDGKWTNTALDGHKHWINFGAFSPDGTRIVTVSSDRTARVWHRDKHDAWTSAVLEGHPSEVMSAAFSPDGTRIATVSGDARIWQQGKDGSWKNTVLEERVRSAAFSPDGTRIVTALRDNTARVWQDTGQSVWTSVTLKGHRADLKTVAFSPDGSRIVTASADNSARVWQENEQGVWNSAVLIGHMDSVTSAAFSPDGTRIVTASNDSTARIWRESEDGVWISSVLDGHENSIQTATFSPNGKRVVTVAVDTAPRVWSEGKDGAWASTALQGHADFVTSAAFSQDGTRIVTISYDETARVWREGEDGTWNSTALEGLPERADSAVFSPDGRSILTTSFHAALVWDIDWLTSDAERERLNLKAVAISLPAIKPHACETLRRASRVWVQDTLGNKPRLKHFYTELTDDDLRAAPLLRSMGYTAGEDVCEASAPKGIDELLTRWLPRKWWSRLDWED